MTKISGKDILQALTSINDPNSGKDIVSLGMVQTPQIKDGHVTIVIETNAHRAPSLEPLRRQAEQVVTGLPGISSASVILTAERDGIPEKKQSFPKIKKVIAIASGKGGVGKSTIAANLAVVLQKSGLSVGLFDADLFGPSQPRIMGVANIEPVSSDDGGLEPVIAHGIKMMSIGFLVPENNPVIWRGPMVMRTLEQLMRDIQWGELDLLIIDMPPGTGDTQLTIAQNLPLAGAIIVSTPQDIALLDSRKGLNMFLKLGVPILGIIENMSIYRCPNCGHQAEIFGHDGARIEAENLAIDFLGALPLDIAIRTSADAGNPLAASQSGTAFEEIARKIRNKLFDQNDD